MGQYQLCAISQTNRTNRIKMQTKDFILTRLYTVDEIEKDYVSISALEFYRDLLNELYLQTPSGNKDSIVGAEILMSHSSGHESINM